MFIFRYFKELFKKKMLKDFLIYGSTDAINKAIPFLLLPILTNYLSPSDYGILASFNSLFAIFIIFIGLSVNGAITIKYYKLNREELRKYIGNILYILMLSSLLAFIVVSIFSGYLESLLKIPEKWMFILIIISVGFFLTQINLSLFLAEQKAIAFGIYNLCDTVLKIGITIFLVVIKDMNWEGNAYGIFVGSLIMSTVSIITLTKRKYIKFGIHKEYLLDALKFGIPLIPHQIGSWFRKGGIVLLLVYLVGEKETGLYDVGNKFVLIISLATASFFKVYQPYLFRTLSAFPNYEYKRKLVIYSYFFMFFMLLMAIGVSILSPYLINVMLNESFYESNIFIWNLSLAAAFQGMNLVVVGYIFYENKNTFLAINTMIFSILQIILAYILIPIYGPIGAAKAATISFFMSFVSTWVYSARIYNMPWLLRKI